jgi:hypothetical protein
MNRLNYEAVQQEAVSREMTVAGLVEFALGTIGVPVVTHPQQSPELVRATAVSRAKRAKSLRRSVSMNRLNYEAAKKAAASRGMTIAGLVGFALGAIGVSVGAPPQQSPKLVSTSAAYCP